MLGTSFSFGFPVSPYFQVSFREAKNPPKNGVQVWTNTHRLVRPIVSSAVARDVFVVDLDWFRLNDWMLLEMLIVPCEISPKKSMHHVMSSYGFIVVFMHFSLFCYRCDTPFFGGEYFHEIGQVSGESTSQQFRRTMSTLVRQTSKSSSLRWEEVKDVRTPAWQAGFFRIL